MIQELFYPQESFQAAISEDPQSMLTEKFLKEVAGPSTVPQQQQARLEPVMQKLFDGDRPLEIVSGATDQPKQKWLMIMNLAVDFGGECTIEKRTRKLQELAKQTEGTAVTIVVQAAARDRTGQYQLDRFALKDGQIVKLESPGKSKGYGADVESLVSFATKTYPSNNLGLILDSHGDGDKGLQGDNGDISLKQLKELVQRSLQGSGHDKLDVLQFDACLMSQNGVLETTAQIARHVVASAEPEGVTADTAAADNKNLSALLKNPRMTADQFAQTCVALAKDVQGFNTLAHFDMAKYTPFRQALDEFGAQLGIVCEQPAQLQVVRNLISQTFRYGTGSFRVTRGPGTIDGAKDTYISGTKPYLSFGKPDGYGDKPDAYGGKPDGYGGKPDGYGGKPDGYGGKPDAYGGKPDGYGGKPDGYGGKPDGFGGKPDYYGSLPGFLDRPTPTFSRTLRDTKHDLKNFVEKVRDAIASGQLKDPDGKLRAAAQNLLTAQAALTRSSFVRGDRQALGGLSIFIPQSAGTYATDDVCTSGSWCQLERRLRTDTTTITPGDIANNSRQKPRPDRLPDTPLEQPRRQPDVQADGIEVWNYPDGSFEKRYKITNGVVLIRQSDANAKAETFTVLQNSLTIQRADGTTTEIVANGKNSHRTITQKNGSAKTDKLTPAQAGDLLKLYRRIVTR